MKYIFSIFILALSNALFAQNLLDFEQVDEFMLDDISVKVYFKDPFKAISVEHPEFDSKENQRNTIFSLHSCTTTLYICFKRLRMTIYSSHTN
ncbi:MAG: hypothetical protein R2852_09975 [Bacteroidia bacterium]